MPGPSKEVVKHLSQEELDTAIDDAQKADETRLVRRLCLVKNLYAGDSITEAGSRVGVTQPTASRWTERWNNHGVDGLRPDFGGGRPPKLTEKQQEQLCTVLEAHQPLTTEHIQRLIEDGFDVSYSQRHVSRLLKKLGIKHTVARPESPEHPDDADDLLEQRLEAALEELDDDVVVTDGGVVVGFRDEAWPHPADNSRRL